MRRGSLLLLLALVLVVPIARVSAQAAPALPSSAYGPYAASFLLGGSGLTEPLAGPLNPNVRAAAIPSNHGIGDGNPANLDPLLNGAARWTLCFWFRASEPFSGTVLLAGLGNPAGADARYIGLEAGRPGLWLGTAGSPSGLTAATQPLDPSRWHFALATSDGAHITLFIDGVSLLSASLHQGTIAPLLEMGPMPLMGISTTHFGGRIAALRIYREAFTDAEVKDLFDARPDFNLPHYTEASPSWPVQVRGQAGQQAPQNPSTLPRGKAPIQKPLAQPLTPEELDDQLAGSDPWKLRGGWRLQAAPQVQATGAEIAKSGFDDKDWLVATVPGTVLTTLVDRGVYPDPYYGLNNLAIPETLAHQDYWYRVEFKAPAAARGRHLTLTFNGVNYAAEVWLNGKRLGSFTGAFLRGTFDVTGLVTSGTNALAVRVSPPPHAGIPQEESLSAGPGENGGTEVLDGPTFAASEGWDWIPSIRDRDTGIWQDVTLTASGAVQIGDLQVVTTLPKPDRSEADVEIQVPLINADQKPVDGTLTISFDDVKVSKRVRLMPGENDVRLEPADYPQLKVQHPRLWWPNGYGAPTLHTLRTSFSVDGKDSSEKQIQFGMREVSYELSLFDSEGHLRRVEIMPSRTFDQETALIDSTHTGIRRIDDETPNLPLPAINPGKEKTPDTWVQTLEPGAATTPSVQPVAGGWPGTDLVILVNGVRIVARGGNWGMDDAMKRVSTAHLEPYFRLHRDAHVNLIRNWMGQDTEESFYALADKYGIMVWNDFWDSTEDYNLEAENPAIFLKNARDTILRFRHHPSIVVWCGRNEGVPQAPINQGLAELVRTLDHTRYYTPSSNRVNLRGSGPYMWQPPSTYYRINRGFSVELGMPSVPTLESLKSFIPAPDRWPISDTWAYHDWHQSRGGNVAPYMEAMSTEFGAPTSFDDFVRKAQMLDYAGYRAIFEGMTAHLWQPSSGRMIWMTQPAWPSMMWNFLGWDYDTQSSFYGTMKALEPVHVQLNLEDGNVDLINFGAARAFAVRTRVLTLDGRTLSDHTATVQAAADNRTTVTQLRLAALANGHTVFVVLDAANASGALVSHNFYWWSEKESTLRELDTLPATKVTASASPVPAKDEKGVRIALTNSGSTTAVLVKLTLEDAATGKRILPAYYSDNYVSLLPGEQRTITIDYPSDSHRPAIGLRGWNLAEQKVDVR